MFHVEHVLQHNEIKTNQINLAAAHFLMSKVNRVGT